jgi:iron complex outermembrane receptor protein
VRAVVRACVLAAGVGLVLPAHASTPPSLAQVRDLADLSIEELSQIEVTSVSRRAEPLRESPASVYVITADEIRRSGALTLPEALRLAPNLEVARFNSSGYLVSARGFNSVNASNKLLVLIDGRSLFTPQFNSVLWDQEQVLLADVDRIEVISGPGGTLWGANAVNGVINVITKSAADTQGGLVQLAGGNFERRAAVRWGGRLGDVGAYRAYVLGFGEDSTRIRGGGDAHDDWHGGQAGFRADVRAGDDAFTFEGNAYDNRVDTPAGERYGGNVQGRWTRGLGAAGQVEVQAYYDEQDRRDEPAGGFVREESRTLDVQAQHSFDMGERHRIVWGLGNRSWRDRFVNTGNPFVLDPQAQTLNLANVFVQDTITLARNVRLVLGTKFEHSSFSGWAVMPNVRLGVDVAPGHFVWAAVSRAVRPPSRLERDLTWPGVFPTSPAFQSEKVVAYEAGWRAQLALRATASVSVFYNDYSDLRTTTPTATQTFGNALEGHTYGIEAWGSVSPLPGWRIDPGVTLLHKDFHLKPGEVDISGTQTVLGHDPAHQWFVRTFIDLPRDVQLYAGLRRIAALTDVEVPAYTEAELRIAWRVTPALELSLAGYDLLHVRHAEASIPPVQEIPRRVRAMARWTF